MVCNSTFLQDSKNKCIKIIINLGVPWQSRLGLGTFTAVAPGSMPGQGTKIPQNAKCKKKKLCYLAHMYEDVICDKT